MTTPVVHRSRSRLLELHSRPDPAAGRSSRSRARSSWTYPTSDGARTLACFHPHRDRAACAQRVLTRDN